MIQTAWGKDVLYPNMMTVSQRVLPLVFFLSFWYFVLSKLSPPLSFYKYTSFYNIPIKPQSIIIQTDYLQRRTECLHHIVVIGAP